VNRFAVGQQNDAQDSIPHFGNPPPAANATVGLNGLFLRLPHHTLNPLLADDGPVRALAGVEEILRMFHRRQRKVPKCRRRVNQDCETNAKGVKKRLKEGRNKAEM
jgi:hypothetical protein